MSTASLYPEVKRPPNLWQAWAATAEYVTQHTQDSAKLYLAWNSHGVDAPWMAQFNWASNLERVQQKESAGEALDALWRGIAQSYRIFQNDEDAKRAPRSYPLEQWVEEDEHTLLSRLLSLANQADGGPSTLLIVYTGSADKNATSIQARLICHSQALTISGEGTTLLQALQELYPRAANKLD